jgi:hypothetical protein
MAPAAGSVSGRGSPNLLKAESACPAVFGRRDIGSTLSDATIEGAKVRAAPCAQGRAVTDTVKSQTKRIAVRIWNQAEFCRCRHLSDALIAGNKGRSVEAVNVAPCG